MGPSRGTSKAAGHSPASHVEFYNQFHNLGGRDWLVIANFMVNDVPVLYTHDHELLALKRIASRKTAIRIEDPLKT